MGAITNNTYYNCCGRTAYTMLSCLATTAIAMYNKYISLLITYIYVYALNQLGTCEDEQKDTHRKLMMKSEFEQYV